MNIDTSHGILTGIIFLFIAYYLTQGPKETKIRNENTKFQETILNLQNTIAQLKTEKTNLQTENIKLKAENLELQTKLTKKKGSGGGSTGFQDPHIADILKKI